MATQEKPLHFSPRQWEVIHGVEKGESALAIARRLGCAVKTVRFHIARISDKLPGDLPAMRKIIVWRYGEQRTVPRI